MPSSNLDPSKENQISELLAQCEASLSSRDFEKAIDSCRTMLSIAPDNQRAKELMDEAQSKLEAELFVKENLRKAQEYFQARDYQKCINECQKIQLLDAENPSVVELMNRAQEKLEAEPFIQNFINSGQSLFDSGLYSEAIAQWEKVRSIDPMFPSLDELINNAKQKIGGVESSAPMFELATEGVQEIPFESFSGGGFDASQLGMEVETGTDEEKIRQLLAQGDQLCNAGQYQQAIEVWSEIFMLDVNHPVALQKIEEARAASTEKRKELQELIKNAQLAYDQGNTSEAYDLFMQVIALDPENSEANKYVEMIGQPAAPEPGSLDELIAMGETAEERGQYREAAQYFSQALAIDAENADLADRIKNLNLLAKKQEQGRILLGNARAFYAEGKVDSARHALSKLLESDPGNQEALDLMREIKEKGVGQEGSTEGAVSAPEMKASLAAPAKAFPIVPAAIIGGLVLVAGGVTAWFTVFHKTETSPPVVSTPTPKKGPKVPKTSVPSNTTQQTNQTQTSETEPDIPIITPEMKEKSVKLFQEANFYFHEKHYSEALAKAEEALKNDPENKDALALRMQVQKVLQDLRASEQKLLDDADAYFEYSEFAGAVSLYEKYLSKHPESKAAIEPQIIKCYYNLGVLSLRQWRCDMAADYFRQVLFIDDKDQLSKEALTLARNCQKLGTADIEIRKQVALMEMRK